MTSYALQLVLHLSFLLFQVLSMKTV